MNKVSN